MKSIGLIWDTKIRRVELDSTAASGLFLRAWRGFLRRQRCRQDLRYLLELDDRLLKDIGLSRREVRRRMKGFLWF